MTKLKKKYPRRKMGHYRRLNKAAPDHLKPVAIPEGLPEPSDSSQIDEAPVVNYSNLWLGVLIGTILWSLLALGWWLL